MGSSSTNEKRFERLVKKRSVCEQNKIYQRLIWAREKLEKSVKDVAELTGIPRSTLSDWEAGIRTTFYEEWQLLMLYYDGALKARFKDTAVYYKGIKIETDFRNFIELGVFKDPTIGDIRNSMLTNKDVEERIKRDIETRRQADKEQKSQLDMFEAS